MLCFHLLHYPPLLLTPQLRSQVLPPKFLSKTASFSLPSAKLETFYGFLARNFSGYRRSFLGVSCSKSSSCSSSPEDDFDVELGRLLALLPEEMRQRVSEHHELHQLIEVVMDLGRKPLARFPSGDFVLSEFLITAQDIEHATSQVKVTTTCLIDGLSSIRFMLILVGMRAFVGTLVHFLSVWTSFCVQVGDFAIDNRAGISRTLHRISGIRNRKGAIVGLTCRVGRAISGSANLLRDLVQDGASLLLIGPPGVGKTTIIRLVITFSFGIHVMLLMSSFCVNCGLLPETCSFWLLMGELSTYLMICREIARMLANDCNKRVMIVDTSNEIAGDGDIPHAGIGNARRMQVPNSDMQHKV